MVKIEQSSKIRFIFNPKEIKTNQKVSIDAKDEKLKEILTKILSPLKISFELSGNRQIMLFKKDVGFNINPLQLPAITTPKSNAINISGKVKDATGDPMVGVNIQVKGTINGASTDVNGLYKLTVPNTESVLIFTFIGYEPKEIKVGNQTIIDVMLIQDEKALDEVVVVGYGTQEKVNLTGAVGVASGKVLANRPISTAGEGLQGVIPNLNVNVRNGDPTAAVTFNIRGFQSINGGSPLILVDGVPMDINRINPNDIKSISVLKDAGAAAVYGARAAFGVVLIETKQAQSGKIKVNYSNQFTLSKSIFNTDLETDPYQFVLARNVAQLRSNNNPAYDADYVAGTKAYSENPDTAPQWKVLNGNLRFYGNNNYQNKVLTDFSPGTQHDLSVSGGSEKSKLYASVGYVSKDGYLKINNEKFNRYNVLLKGDFKLNDWISLDEKIVFNSQNSDKPHFYSNDVNVNSIARVEPLRPIEFPDLEFYVKPGDRETFAPYIGKYIAGVNFLPYLQDGGRTTFTNNDVWLTQGITLTPLKGLKIRSDFTYNMFNRNYQDVQSRVDVVNTNLLGVDRTTTGYSADDWVSNTNDYNQYSVLNAYAEYSFPNLRDHHLTTMIGFNQESGLNKSISGQNRSLITPNVTDLDATTGTQLANGGKSHVALRGAFYRLNYNYKERYLLEFNGRYDGSSRFSKDTRFGFFPSFSAGWRISNESFMENTTGWLDNLKLRASYGTLGNQQLGSNYYPYIATMASNLSPYIFSTTLTPTVSPAGLVSPTLTWETVVSKNIGLDFTLLKGRLDVSLDAYTRDTKDMLMNVSYPAILGTAAPKENAADLRTSGWEAAITWRDKIKGNWNYDITLALSGWNAKITKYNNPTGDINSYYVGQKLGEIWGYETVGIFQTPEEVLAAPSQAAIGGNWRAGDIQYKDLNGDGKIDNGNGTLSNLGDRKIIGNTTPKFSFGINTGLSYKNFKLITFFQGVGKKDYVPPTTRWTWFYPFQSGYVEKYFMTDSWSETNRDAYFPAPDYLNTKNIAPQTRFLQNAAYIRLKSVTFSYNLPEKLVRKVGLGMAQVYASGMNLWEFSKIRKPLDPEAINTGFIEYPMQRLGTVGMNLSF